MFAYPRTASTPTTSGTLCVPLAPDRVLAIPAYVPISIIVIVLVICGCSISAATTALVAIGAAVRELEHRDDA